MESALELSKRLGELFHMRFGELVIQYAGGEPVLVREGRTYKADELDLISLAPEDSAAPRARSA